MRSVLSFHNRILPHLVAAVLALVFAWVISGSIYVKSGVQFVAPLLVMIFAHLIWLVLARDLRQGFSTKLFSRTAQTAIGLAFFVFVASILAPTPAQASLGDAFGAVLGALFCLAVLAALVAILALVITLVFKLVRGIWRKVRASTNDHTDTRMYDIASVVVVVIGLSLASLEGVTRALTFPMRNVATATRIIDAPPNLVWQRLETATSPAFRLPSLLQVFPQPVDVVIDEGTQIGAMRQVAFRGREGAGDLTLRVVERRDDRAVFAVLSDTSPIANWVAHRYLTYRVSHDPRGTRLDVTLEFDRQLSPSWFFTPLTKGAAYLAMDVLARDVKLRSETGT